MEDRLKLERFHLRKETGNDTQQDECIQYSNKLELDRMDRFFEDHKVAFVDRVDRDILVFYRED